jgi:hypothetical protein
VGVARRIWLHKNEVIYGGNFVPPAMLMKLSTDVVVDFQKANEMDPSVMTMDKTSGWIAPSSGWVVAHWDAAIDCTKGKAGTGCDPTGQGWAICSNEVVHVSGIQ